MGNSTSAVVGESTDTRQMPRRNIDGFSSNSGSSVTSATLTAGVGSSLTGNPIQVAQELKLHPVDGPSSGRTQFSGKFNNNQTTWVIDSTPKAAPSPPSSSSSGKGGVGPDLPSRETTLTVSHTTTAPGIDQLTATGRATVTTRAACEPENPRLPALDLEGSVQATKVWGPDSRTTASASVGRRDGGDVKAALGVEHTQKLNPNVEVSAKADLVSDPKMKGTEISFSLPIKVTL